MTTIHASCVAVGATGVLVRGGSGAGKSRLAHRILLQAPLYGLEARLVADDRVALDRTAGGLLARPPEALRGLLEVRGVGIVRLPFAAEIRLGLVLDLLPLADIPRMPDAGQSQVCLEGVTLPRAFAAGPETGLEVLLTVMGQGGARLDPDLPLASVRFDGKTATY